MFLKTNLFSRGRNLQSRSSKLQSFELSQKLYFSSKSFSTISKFVNAKTQTQFVSLNNVKPTEQKRYLLDIGKNQKVVALMPEPGKVSDLVVRTEWIPNFSGLLIFLGIGLGLFLDSLFSTNEEERQKNLEESDEIVEGLQFLRLIPYKALAQYLSKKAKEEWTPKDFERFVRIYRPQLKGLDKSLDQYKTFEDFFTRKYSDTILNMLFTHRWHQDANVDVVRSPVEGTVMSFQKISSGLHKEYVKDEWYSAKQLLGFNPFDEAKRIRDERIKLIEENTSTTITQIPEKDMYACVLYLSPGNLHRFYAPVDWTCEKRIYHSGNYYPVRSSYLNFFHYKSLLGSNERVALSGEWRHGFFSFIPVGATNVGSIHLTSEPEFDNVNSNAIIDINEYSEPIRYSTGDEIGYFSLGSTVVLVFEYDKNASVMVKPGQHLILGEPLLVRQNDFVGNKSKIPK